MSLQCCSVSEPQLSQNSPRVLLHQTEQVAFGALGAQHVPGEALHRRASALLVRDAVSWRKVSLHTQNCGERAHVPRVLLHETRKHFVYQEEGAPRRSLGRSSSQVLTRNANPVHVGLVDVLQEGSADISGQVAFPSVLMRSTRNIGHKTCSRSSRSHRR